MAKTTIDSRGVVTTKGSGITFSSPVTVSGGTQRAVDALTSASTITKDGVFTVSGSAAVTTTLPDPSDVPGGQFIFRSLSAHAHLLSSSQVTQDTLTITDGTDHGTRIALPNVVGSSVVFVSDGLNYLITSNSGSYTIATPSS